jgi:putative ABC transport system permease protein
MLKHLFTLIWNKKKKNFLIMLELFFSFLILFAVFTLIVNYYQSYKQPRGFEYEDVWAVNRTAAGNAGSNTMSRDSAILLDRIVKQQIKSMRGIQDVSYSAINTPYAGARSTVRLQHEDQVVISDIYVVEDSYANVLGMTMSSGRWFSKEDDAVNNPSTVLSEKLSIELFGSENALNKLINFNQKNYKIVGVVNNVKNEGDYKEAGNGFYIRADSNFYGNNNPILVKVKSGTDARLEASIFKSLSSLMKNTSIDIVHLDEKRENANKLLLLPVIVVLIVVIFFIINVALGIFGVLWHNINKRKGEIGLRRAIGASGSNISRQMVLEVLALTTLSVVAGSFLAIQFPLLNILDVAANTYLIALGLAIAFIYIFVTLCALYPAKQAADIYPAIALHSN